MAPGRETQPHWYRTYGTIDLDQQQQRPQHVEVAVDGGSRDRNSSRNRPRSTWKIVFVVMLLAALAAATFYYRLAIATYSFDAISSVGTWARGLWSRRLGFESEIGST